mmetsp:Transcript_938/g.1753  ORF Transcript_938/g.1753 Transcript_938/m.1753 type:complete len:109 (-) Transcript_938:581-907(-)|eukprot:CAMPEP_0202491636 /NCGR_PEP_ID=MMETSP1361-20130828/8627_1 /ASSEMBLY_ACC=CAM_ASM_000849 /TAXON_ID=210615 /ORGANISM="Staurosira complex sp., Strain CCMP2646" /LENGTH=108 /DNA_ID=CAMNT_0049121721 /DNA_START=336 /DNA_END=665 /DNA_ORIENTATION=-
MDMSIWTSVHVRPMFERSLDQAPHLGALVVALSVAWGVWGSWRTKEKKNETTFGFWIKSQNRHERRSLERENAALSANALRGVSSSLDTTRATKTNLATSAMHAIQIM